MKRGERLPQDEIGIEVIEEEKLSHARVDAIVSLLFRWWLREFEATKPAEGSEVSKRKEPREG